MAIALAVVGSRSCKTPKDKKRVFKKLDSIHSKIGISCIVSGRAVGPDSFAEAWAIERGVDTEIFLPDWKKHGRAAGFIRNNDIVEACDRLLAFWDGSSKGTEHSINLARKKSRPRKVLNLEKCRE